MRSTTAHEDQYRLHPDDEQQEQAPIPAPDQMNAVQTLQANDTIRYRNEQACRAAYDDFYHKVRALVDYDHWRAIWNFIGKRFPVAPTISIDSSQVSPELLAELRNAASAPGTIVAAPVSAEPTEAALLKVAESIVQKWQDQERMPPLAWDFRGFLVDGMRAALKAAPVAAHAQPGCTDRNLLRELVDVVWNEATESTAVPDKPWADRLIDRVFGNAQAQQPVSGADGWTLAKKVRRDLDRQSCPDAYMRIAVESIVKHYDPPQLSGNPGQLDHLPDDQNMLAFAEEEEFMLFCDEDEFLQIARAVLQQFGGKSGRPQPSGNSGELNFQVEYEVFKDAAFNKSGSPIGLMDGKNAAWWAWVNRAALAQQDADTVDAERYRKLRAMATQQADSLGPIFRIDVRRSAPYLFNFDAAIDAARKE